MVYRFRPLELKLDFEDRQYRLGDTIDVTVDMMPNGDVDVRQARVDLVCEERFVQISAPESAGYSAYGTPTQVHSAMIQTQKESKETYVHSSETFLSRDHLRANSPLTLQVALPIQLVPPRHLEDARALDRDAYSSWSFKWRLIALVDIVRGRNPKRQRTVKIRLD